MPIQAPKQEPTSDAHYRDKSFDASHFDESAGAIKLLLPPLTGKHILYIGADERDTARNIASSCTHLTAIYVSKQSYQIQLEKKQLRSWPSNINILFWDTQSEIFQEAQKFDGIIIDQAIGVIQKSQQEISFIKILNYLNKNAWVFIKAKNSLNRNQLIQTLKHPGQVFTKKTAIKNNYRNTHFYKQLLKKQDLIEYRSYSFDHYNLTADNIINLNNKAEVAIFCEHEKFKHLPFRLYKLTTPVFGIFATNYKPRSSPEPTLKLIIRKSLTLLNAQTHQVLAIEVNRKCKCVITLEVFRPYSELVMIKVPLNELANKHLDHSYKGLKLINNALASNRTNNPAQQLFPKTLGSNHIDQTHFYIESKLNIVEPKNNKQKLVNKLKIKEITNSILNIRQIQIPKDIDSEKHNTLDSINQVKEFIDKNYPQLLANFIELTNKIEQNANQKNIQYFYKSDFSMSNTFFDNNKIQGILDFDFWGFSHNKLVDFADFVLSSTRTLYKIQYKEALVAINKGDLSYFPEVLNLEHNISYLNSTIEEFQEAAIIAWLNSISHLIEFKHIKLNQKRLEPLLIEPLYELTKAQP